MALGFTDWTLAAMILLTVLWLARRRNSRNLPPGPVAFPIIGNLLSIPRTYKPRNLRDMATKNGWDITYFHGLGQKILVVNNRCAMAEIVVKQCDKTSGRPVLTMCGELCGYTNSVVLKQPGKDFRHMRREINLAVGKGGAASRDALLDKRYLGKYLEKMYETPDDLFEHSRWLLGAFTLGIAYGYKPQDRNDAFINDAGRAIAEFADLVEPVWLIDVFPFLKYILMRIPKFQRMVKQFKQSQLSLSMTPYKMVKEQLRDGIAPPSVLATLIHKNEGRELTPRDEVVLAWTAGNIYAGGSDTTVSTLTSFYLAMCYAPEVQRKAQAEIDQFAESKERWPNLRERKQFPYVQAVITELYRWGVVAPLGIPHRVVEDLLYGDCVIPKDTTLLTNAWAICHDETIYPEPFEFQPERFLGEARQLDPREFVFGGGRRVCPGVDMADAILFMTISAVLAVFDVQPIKDCPPPYSYQDRMARHPSPFRCRVSYRSSKVEDWIKQALVD